ncbi:hypothetical protein GQ42DRAFT_159880 [Ramicandelaber brevisporus]|nr:hypothetical protein GQ42DRAFT_159880 [Ramicandelaber brevisporus]
MSTIGKWLVFVCFLVDCVFYSGNAATLSEFGANGQSVKVSIVAVATVVTVVSVAVDPALTEDMIRTAFSTRGGFD